MLALHDVTVRWPGAAVTALRGIGLTLAAREKLALLGESGSGKSTLARTVAGLLPKGAQVTGQLDWADGPPRPGRDIGYVFQDPAGSLNPLLSIGAHLAEVLRSHLPLTRAAARTRAAELLAMVRVPQPEAALDAFPHQFSGGQLQRIAIALAMAAGPRLLIADEATSALDMLVQAEIVALLADLTARQGMSLLFITHDMALAGTLADRIAVMHDGQLIEVGEARQILSAPAQPYTRSLLAAHLDLDSPRLVDGTA